MSTVHCTDQGGHESVLEGGRAARVGGQHLEDVLAEAGDHRVTVVFQKYGDGQGQLGVRATLAHHLPDILLSA